MKKTLKEFSDQELEGELNRRKDQERLRKQAEVKEQQRIYNLPENVAARKKKAQDQQYKQMLCKVGLPEDTKGTWKIYGEDPNCDMGGPHHEPYLGKVEGRLSKVIRYAMNLSGFYSWGAGGRIVLSEPETIKKL